MGSLQRAVLVSIADTCRLIFFNMNGFTKTFFLALVASSASASKIDASLREGSGLRDGKSLLNTFPFNNGRQGAGRQAAHHGERCIDKVVMQETTEYDDVITCKHSYSEKCHTTYTTDFEPQQEEECE